MLLCFLSEICYSPGYLESKMGSTTSQLQTVPILWPRTWRRVWHILGPSNVKNGPKRVILKSNFHLKRQKCEDWEHLGSCF